MPNWSWWDDQVGEESALQRALRTWGERGTAHDEEDARHDRTLWALLLRVVDDLAREGGQRPAPPLVLERAERLPGGTWKVELMSVRGTGYDAAGATRAQAVAGALRRVAEAEGFPPGLCCGCGGALEERQAHVGAVAHEWCVADEGGR